MIIGVRIITFFDLGAPKYRPCWRDPQSARVLVAKLILQPNRPEDDPHGQPDQGVGYLVQYLGYDVASLATAMITCYHSV